MNEKDRAVVLAIAELGHPSHREIAAKVNLPLMTVHARIVLMLEQDILTQASGTKRSRQRTLQLHPSVVAHGGEIYRLRSVS